MIEDPTYFGSSDTKIVLRVPKDFVYQESGVNLSVSSSYRITNTTYWRFLLEYLFERQIVPESPILSVTDSIHVTNLKVEDKILELYILQ